MVDGGWIEVREKQVPIPPFSQVSHMSKAWSRAILDRFGLTDQLSWEDFSVIIQALVDHTHSEVMLKVERALVMESRGQKGDV